LIVTSNDPEGRSIRLFLAVARQISAVPLRTQGGAGMLLDFENVD
jgi:hypothetical protein